MSRQGKEVSDLAVKIRKDILAGPLRGEFQPGFGRRHDGYLLILPLIHDASVG
jgi:hypothetical protein